MNEAIVRSNKKKLRWGIVLITAPGALIIISILLYAVLNFLFGLGSDTVAHRLINVVLYIVGAIGVLSIIPAIVGGVLLIVFRKDPRIHTIPAPQTGGVPPAVVPVPVVPGRTESILGLVFAFIGLGVPGLVLSIIGYKKSVKTGHADVIATIGIVFNSLAVGVGIIYLGVVTFVTINEYNHPSKSESSTTRSI